MKKQKQAPSFADKLRELSSAETQMALAEERVANYVQKVRDEMHRRAEADARAGGKHSSWKFDRPASYTIAPMSEQMVLERIVRALEADGLKAETQINDDGNSGWKRLWVSVSW